MKIVFEDGKEFEVLSVDNNATLGEERVSIRLSIALTNTSYSIEELLAMNLNYSNFSLITDNDATIIFKEYKLESIRKSYGNDRLSLELVKR